MKMGASIVEDSGCKYHDNKEYRHARAGGHPVYFSCFLKNNFKKAA
jgi:hypothetical protein